MKAMILAALAAAAAIPAVAADQPAGGTPPKQATAGPHTIKGELTLFQFNNYNGDNFVVDGTSRVVKTDWPIKSLSIHPGDKWEICARSHFRECIVVDRSVPDASALGIVNQIGSARPARTGERG